jgi:hypothetical protein
MAFYFVSTFAIAQTPTKQSALRLSRTKNLHFVSFCCLLGLGCPKQAFAKIATPRLASIFTGFATKEYGIFSGGGHHFAHTATSIAEGAFELQAHPPPTGSRSIITERSSDSEGGDKIKGHPTRRQVICSQCSDPLLGRDVVTRTNRGAEGISGDKTIGPTAIAD